jgi:hypothetical protein
MHHFHDINVSTVLILLAACVQDGGWRTVHNRDFINYFLLILICIFQQCVESILLI